MKEIIKNGNYKNKTFSCYNCGCFFETDEYYEFTEEKSQFVHNNDVHLVENVYWCAKCPQCKYEVFNVQTKVTTRYISPIR